MPARLLIIMYEEEAWEDVCKYQAVFRINFLGGLYNNISRIT